VPFSFYVHGFRPIYAQPTSNTCWSACYSMLRSYRTGVKYHSCREGIQPMGDYWLKFYDTDTPIPQYIGPKFVTDTNLSEEALSPDVGTWNRLLVSYGLLWVSTLMPQGLHDRVVAGIDGDGSASGTNMLIMDPNGGKTYLQNYGEFMAQFAAQGSTGNFGSDYQILHGGGSS